MPSEASASNLSFIASGALTVNRFAKLHSTAGQAIVAEDGTAVDGVVAMTVATGKVVPIMTKSGAEVPIELGATLAAAAIVMPSTAGVAIAATGAGAMQAGKLIDGGVSGDIVRMLFNPMRLHA